MTTLSPIVFHRPSLAPRELDYVAQALQSAHTSGDGPFTRRASSLLSAEMQGLPVLLTTSCTHALEMAAILLGLMPGDEVIIPAFTFVSTVNAFCMRGAVPVFCDVRADTLNLDESLLPSLITSKTKVIVPVHYAGVACEMDSIMAIATERGIAVVEDNAHGLFGRYRGRPLGTFGVLASQSFHQSKNVSCGEGGALVLGDPALRERAEIIREKGTNRSRFFRGEIDKYGWVDVGSSYLPSDILAAALLAQLEDATAMQARRAVIATRYDTELASWASSSGVRLPVVPDGIEPALHLYALRFASLAVRTAFIAHMRDAGIMVTFHYQALNAAEMAAKLSGPPRACPVTEDAAETLARLPLFPAMSDDDVARVIAAACAFSC